MGFEIGFYLVEAGVEAETAFAIGAAIEGAAVTIGKLLILSAVSQALSKRPGLNSGSGAVGAQGRNLTIRQAISPWEIVAGRVRKGGTFTFIHQSTDGTYLHMIITLAGHVSESIDEVWFDDFVLTLGGNGYETSRYVRVTTFGGLVAFGGSTVYTVPDFASAIKVEGVVDSDFDSGNDINGELTDVSPSDPASPTEYKRVGATYTFFPTQKAVTITYNDSFVRIKS